MHANRIVVLISVILVLAACQQESSPPLQAENGNSNQGHQAVTAKSSPAIVVDPGTLKSCDGAVASVRWDASKANVTTDSTEIWVGSSDADTKLFSAGGSAGVTKTGPWTHPGTHFVLKNKQDGRVLGEAIVGGPACQS